MSAAKAGLIGGLLALVVSLAGLLTAEARAAHRTPRFIEGRDMTNAELAAIHQDTQPVIIPTCAVHHTGALSTSDFFEVDLPDGDSVCAVSIYDKMRRSK